MENTTKGTCFYTNKHDAISVETFGSDICVLNLQGDSEQNNEQYANANLFLIAGNLAQKFDPETWETRLTQFDEMKTALEKIENIDYSNKDKFDITEEITKIIASLTENNEKP